MTVGELGLSTICVYNWVRQDASTASGPGFTRAESAELKTAHKRIRELEQEVAILRLASKLLGQDRPHPKGFTR